MVRGIDTEDLPAGGGGGNFIRGLKIKEDGESARIWFLTEGDDVFFESFHWCDNADAGEKLQLCAKSLGQTCANCELSEEKGSGVGAARTEFFLWVYELEHYYIEKPKKVDSMKVRIGSLVLYKVDVNAPMLMRYSVAHRATIKNRWERHGTLTDRPFFWIRSGEKASTRYELEADDKERMPKDLKELMNTLPDPEDVALGKVDKLDGEKTEEKSSKKYAVRDVEEDDEEKTNEFTKPVAEVSEEEPEDDQEDNDNGDDSSENPFD
jgi:hypothetical protein